MEEKVKKLNFWRRIQYSIFKLENYGKFLEEKSSVSVKYFLLLVLLITFAISIVETGIFTKMINKGYSYIVNELPDFEYRDGKLKMSEEVKAFDEEYQFYFIVNTDENITQEKIKEYKEEIYNTYNGILLLNNKAIYIYPGSEMEYNLSDVFYKYEINEAMNKQLFLERYNENGSAPLILMYFIVSLIQMYIVNVITILMDVVVLAIFGLIAAMICGIKMKFSQMFKVAIHAITLPVIITGIYTVVFSLTGFVIKYYNMMYLLISYIYVVAAILMIKTDLMKQKEELIKIEEVQKEVKKELEEKEEENKEEKKEKGNEKDKEKNKEGKEPDINAEPDGSEI